MASGLGGTYSEIYPQVSVVEGDDPPAMIAALYRPVAQRILRRAAQPSGDQQRTDLITVQPTASHSSIEPQPGHARGRGVLEQVLFDGAAVERGDRAQPAGDRRRGPGQRLHRGAGAELGNSV